MSLAEVVGTVLEESHRRSKDHDNVEISNHTSSKPTDVEINGIQSSLLNGVSEKGAELAQNDSDADQFGSCSNPSVSPPAASTNLSRKYAEDLNLYHRHGRVRANTDVPRLSLNSDTSPKSPLSPLKRPSPDTPSTRTGPPRSISYSLSTPSSPVMSHKTLRFENEDIPEDYPDEVGFPFLSHPRASTFRDPLEISTPRIGEYDRKGKGKETRPRDETRNYKKWFESPREDKTRSSFNFSEMKRKDKGVQEIEEEGDQEQGNVKGYAAKSSHKESFSSDLQRSHSHPPPLSRPQKRAAGSARWGRLRSLLPAALHHAPSSSLVPTHSVVTPNSVNITDELIAGGLSTLMLRLWYERDEKGHRRIPVLFHRLRIRISDSLHPLQGQKSVFRIECEYANGSARWVVYRQLRDFVSLHTHYAFSNAYYRNVDALPEFPKTSLPYFKFLKRENRGNQIQQADFARLQRAALEDYLIRLIRAVMFHPSANRLAGFLEISALFISLSPLGGYQYKAGFLRIEASGNKGGAGLGRKNTRWKERKESRWCAVRDSCLVISEQPGELVVWDVFLFDSDFKIERPIRYYRKGLHLFHPETVDEKTAALREGRILSANGNGGDDAPTAHHNGRVQYEADADCMSVMDSVRSKLSNVFHSRRGRRQRSDSVGHAEKTNGAHHGDHTVVHHRRSHSAATVSSRMSSSGSSSASSIPLGHENLPTPLLDPSTHINPLVHDPDSPDEAGNDAERAQPSSAANQKSKKKRKTADEVSKHTFYIENSQMRLKLFARNERQMLQWITALEKAAAVSHYTGSNRFDSFSPIRLNVAAQWLVDGRDYMWNLSRAILLARDSIYIHDWWLSPELQMRRPNKDKYRLDRLLERKAKEGVKIHIILYQEVSNRTTPTDSNYTKQRLMSLHSNIMVQRSPSHFQTGTFYWAHHEKLCVIDQTIAFMGGIDLCFGRWDTPQHIIVDDPDVGHEKTEIWPGKDYSNPRIVDFHTLNRPEEDMYDRTKVPRMPWHDVGLQIVGQPARDLARHFVERWNYLLRIKNHTRVMPFLVPPPEFKPGELTNMGLTGTCEVQICRSAGPWSLGTPDRIEHSIQNAYLKAIQLSEHFVYIENQFFITSTIVNDVKVENKIGDAIVHRVIRAHHEGTPWKCCIVIPLLPGFPFPVDHSDASAIRIILECQNRTLSRGPDSIFARLRKEGIDPDKYISIFSLRNWGKMRHDALSTEIVYIHGKICIVDDRLAIIGSANINERSQRGDRDSEIAAVIRDTDMIDGTMAGRHFKVGRFAHSLRIRLMREHVGVDVDALSEEDYIPEEGDIKPEDDQNPDRAQEWDPDVEQEHGQESGVTHFKHETPARHMMHDVTTGMRQTGHAMGDAMVLAAAKKLQKPVAELEMHKVDTPSQDASMQEERMTYTRRGKKIPGFTSSAVPTMEEKMIGERMNASSKTNGSLSLHGDQNGNGENDHNDEPAEARTADGQAFGAPAHASPNAHVDDQPPHISDADDEEEAAPSARVFLRKHLAANFGNKWTVPTLLPDIDPDGFEDPIADDFWEKVWIASAVHNTEIYRKVFHAIPDDLVTTWKQYKEFVVHHERLSKPVKEKQNPEPVARVPSETAYEDGSYQKGGVADVHAEPYKEDRSREGHEDNTTDGSPSSPAGGSAEKDKSTRKATKGTEPFEKWEREQMEELLHQVRGHLVVYPTRFLEGEDVAENFLFNADRLLPLPIYD